MKNVEVKYRVNVGSTGIGAQRQRYVYFASLQAATEFCNEVTASLNLFLSIEVAQ